MPESKLKEYAENYPLLKTKIRELEEVTEKVKRREDFLINLGRQGEKHDFITGYLWGHLDAGLIAEQEREIMFNDLIKIQEENIA